MEKFNLNRVQYDIKKFLVTYEFLTPEARASFEAQMTAQLQNYDPKTRKLYAALLDAARKGEGETDALRKLKEVSDE